MLYKKGKERSIGGGMVLYVREGNESNKLENLHSCAQLQNCKENSPFLKNLHFVNKEGMLHIKYPEISEVYTSTATVLFGIIDQ